MSTQKRLFFVAMAIVLIIAQIACSLGGFTISKEEVSPQDQPAQPAQPVNPAQPGPTGFVVLSTPTSAPAIQVAPPQPGTANAAGRVLWNGQPIIGVEVKLCQEMKLLSGCAGTQFSTTTNDQGYYVFASVTPGEYALVVHGIDADRWIYITAGLSISAKKHQLTAGQTLNVGDQHIFKFDLALTSPTEDEKVSQAKPTLTWNTYPDTAYYEIYVSPRSGESIRENVTENKFTVPNPLLNCEYTWTVEAFNSQGIQIAEHEGYWDFLVTGQSASCEVLLNAPLDGVNLKGTGIEFSWQAHSLATHYMLYVSDENYKYVIDGARVNTTTYTLTQVLPPGQYKWYVSAYDDKDWIASSDHYDFTVSGP